MITKVHTISGPRYIGIQSEAKRLNVSRVHLWQVLSGKRASKSLMKKVHIKEVK
jgi:hypothetical protein